MKPLTAPVLLPRSYSERAARCVAIGSRMISSPVGRNMLARLRQVATIATMVATRTLRSIGVGVGEAIAASRQPGS